MYFFVETLDMIGNLSSWKEKEKKIPASGLVLVVLGPEYRLLLLRTWLFGSLFYILWHNDSEEETSNKKPSGKRVQVATEFQSKM